MSSFKFVIIIIVKDKLFRVVVDFYKVVKIDIKVFHICQKF